MLTQHVLMATSQVNQKEQLFRSSPLHRWNLQSIAKIWHSWRCLRVDPIRHLVKINPLTWDFWGNGWMKHCDISLFLFTCRSDSLTDFESNGLENAESLKDGHFGVWTVTLCSLKESQMFLLTLKLSTNVHQIWHIATATNAE